MKQLIHRFVLLTATFFVLASCNWVSDLIHDGEVVARIGKHKLYRSELAGFIPHDASPEDSARLAGQYINTWAKEILFVDLAGEQLSRTDSDVTTEVEDYRRSLLKYRYEQQYLHERLDTVVAASEIESYYQDHQDLFALQVPIVRARFLDVLKESADLESLRKMMSADKEEDQAMVDSLAFGSALRYADRSGEWLDMPVYAKYFGYDYGTVLSKLRPDGFIVMDEGEADVKIGYVCEMRKPGTVAPLEYCTDRIREIILSNRKHALLAGLEQDLLKDALEQEKLIIY
ncbi:MAG: hypothetical protein II851_03660 [Bacteroidales bacterium]|nr:hypothetical protein [Bacteroidales bacterium]